MPYRPGFARRYRVRQGVANRHLLFLARHQKNDSTAHRPQFQVLRGTRDLSHRVQEPGMPRAQQLAEQGDDAALTGTPVEPGGSRLR